MKYAITGSTGSFGSAAIDYLIAKGIAPSVIVALARRKEKAADLIKKGVDVRIGNYDDIESLKKAFNGVDKVLLVSGSEVGKRVSQHSNVIEAAKADGVKQIVYTSLTKADSSSNPLAPEHKATEKALKESDLDYVILRNNWYMENYAADVRQAAETGILATATGKGKVSAALRNEYAETAANVLIQDGHSRKIYELAGMPWNFYDLAKAASTVYGREIQFTPISAEVVKSNLLQAGMDDGTANFHILLDESIAAGSLEIESNDLASLLGRAPKSLEETLAVFI